MLPLLSDHFDSAGSDSSVQVINDRCNCSSDQTVFECTRHLLPSAIQSLLTMDMQACSICQSEYEPDEVIMILPCEHHFHKDCAMEWLGKHSKKCPICKESIGG